MLSRKWLVLVFASLLIIAATNSGIPNGVEGSQVLTLRKRGYPKSLAFSTLGLVCDCCDGEGGECRSTRPEDACSNLRCHPWKY